MDEKKVKAHGGILLAFSAEKIAVFNDDGSKNGAVVTAP